MAREKKSNERGEGRGGLIFLGWTNLILYKLMLVLEGVVHRVHGWVLKDPAKQFTVRNNTTH